MEVSFQKTNSINIACADKNKDTLLNTNDYGSSPKFNIVHDFYLTPGSLEKLMRVDVFKHCTLIREESFH